MTTQKNATEKAIEALHDAEMHFLMEAGKDAGSPCETRSARHRWNTKQAVYFHEALEALRAAQRVDVEDIRAEIESGLTSDRFTGVRCGVEDRSLYDRYDCAEYGFNAGIEYALSCILATGRLAGIPEGYALVPLEPTPDMLGAIEKGEIHNASFSDAIKRHERYKHIYRAMIAAAQEEK